ncbi:MAG: 3' terminal RNA ribose 2'-O-methyltransferase Hen1 [Candidatus Omnitrophica bacterium]|nr:3' terminal RNA ribose 2'-O-methyltransferase Hen1 [Candidatus Omnitrophota bacterium]MCB9748019.1 3' terminal RNA ribose 2'-O-methyltransferase Hen1 [Candidatus Omnitrophota bacterium]
MILTITTTKKPATDLGYLLHKSPDRCQSTKLSFGTAHVFYPEVSKEKCTAALLLDVDPIEMIRGKNRSKSSMPLEQYVNDKPYVASSFLSVALVGAFGTALNGKCKTKPELVDVKFPLTAKLSVVQARGGENVLKKLFDPLGYKLKMKRQPLDKKFEEWGEGNYFSIELSNTLTVKELLNHLYVLIPVLDNYKHYFVDKQEMEKLLKRGEGWLSEHPEREFIANRYLKYRMSLAREAVTRLSEANPIQEQEEDSKLSLEEELESSVSLNEERHGTVLSALKSHNAEKVIDLGCAEGRFIGLLLKDKSFKKIVGMDVSIRCLEIASQRLKFERMAPMQKERIELMHGSLMYRDKRFSGFDAATAIEVIEHLDPPRLAAFERVLFEFAKPKMAVITTPNVEYNVMWENLPAGKFRHNDHRFEWTRKEFQEWACRVAEKFGYGVKYLPIGPEDKKVGSPTQMAIFIKE